VALLRDARGSADERTLVAGYALAMTLLEQSKFLDAESVLGEVDRDTDSRLPDSETAFKMLALRGMLRAARKQCVGALSDLQAARAIALPPSPETVYNAYNVRSWIGETLDCLGRDREARTEYESLLASGQDAEVGPALAGYARLGFARALQLGGDVDGAERELRAALGILEAGIGEADPFTMGQALVVAGSFYADLGRFEEARADLQRGRALLLGVGEQQEKALTALRVLGTIDLAEGRTREALAGLEQAREGLASVFGADSPDAQAAAFWLAAAHSAVGDARAAADLLAALDPVALRAAAGGDDWAERIELLRAGVMIAEGRHAEGEPRLQAAAQRLKANGAPGWIVEALQRAAQGDAGLRAAEAIVRMPG
jgi:tetratricopeptide (TPR) repeat protein